MNSVLLELISKETRSLRVLLNLHSIDPNLSHHESWLHVYTHAADYLNDCLVEHKGVMMYNIFVECMKVRVVPEGDFRARFLHLLEMIISEGAALPVVHDTPPVHTTNILYEWAKYSPDLPEASQYKIFHLDTHMQESRDYNEWKNNYMAQTKRSLYILEQIRCAIVGQTELRIKPPSPPLYTRRQRREALFDLLEKNKLPINITRTIPPVEDDDYPHLYPVFKDDPCPILDPVYSQFPFTRLNSRYITYDNLTLEEVLSRNRDIDFLMKHTPFDSMCRKSMMNIDDTDIRLSEASFQFEQEKCERKAISQYIKKGGDPTIIPARFKKYIP